MWTVFLAVSTVVAQVPEPFQARWAQQLPCKAEFYEGPFGRNEHDIVFTATKFQEIAAYGRPIDEYEKRTEREIVFYVEGRDEPNRAVLSPGGNKLSLEYNWDETGDGVDVPTLTYHRCQP